MGELLKDIWVGWRFGGTFGARGVSKDRAMAGLKIVLVGWGKMIIQQFPLYLQQGHFMNFSLGLKESRCVYIGFFIFCNTCCKNRFGKFPHTILHLYT